MGKYLGKAILAAALVFGGMVALAPAPAQAHHTNTCNASLTASLDGFLTTAQISVVGECHCDLPNYHVASYAKTYGFGFFYDISDMFVEIQSFGYTFGKYWADTPYDHYAHRYTSPASILSGASGDHVKWTFLPHTTFQWPQKAYIRLYCSSTPAGSSAIWKW